MQLIHLRTNAPVTVGDTLVAVAGVVNGHAIKVQEICPPCERFTDGHIKYNMSDSGMGWQQLIPRVLDCVFFPEDSNVQHVTYDNEKSVADYLREIKTSLEAQGREVRSFLLGDKEWTRISHLISFDHADGMGFTYCNFEGVRVRELNHYETLLAVEHALKTEEVKDGNSSTTNADEGIGADAVQDHQS